MPHTCNLLHGTCALAHTHFGACYYQLPLHRQAALVRVGSLLASWPAVGPQPMPAVATKLAAALLAYSTASTQPLPLHSACQVTANYRKVG